jgi:radical SAM protein (TIGR01212 family)
MTSKVSRNFIKINYKSRRKFWLWSSPSGCIIIKSMERYHSLNKHLKEYFGEKVKKIPIDAGLTCPNRDGALGFGGCIYCDAKGSGTGLAKILTPEEQVKKFIEKFRAKGYKKFILYLQSFSNTYAPLEVLDKLYSLAHLDKDTVGLAIGTRPDCIDEERANLIKKYQDQGYYVWVELGLQSIHDETLRYINRGHTYEDFLRAYHLLKSKGLPVVVHIIFGLPRETKEMMLATVKALSSLRIDGIKFHALYIVKQTPMERLYLKGEYQPLSLEEYAALVAESLALLTPETVVHRLTSDPPRDELVAPDWLLKKAEVLKSINQCLEQRELYQGKFYE